MNNKLYYIAYKFLKIRATQGNPFKVVEHLKKKDKENVFKFLSYNHNVKFI